MPPGQPVRDRRGRLPASVECPPEHSAHPPAWWGPLAVWPDPEGCHYKPEPAEAATASPEATTIAPAGPATAELPAGAAGTPKATAVLESIRTDLDKDLIADLQEVKLRGAVLAVVVKLRLVGNKPESEHVAVQPKSSVLDYDTGEMYPVLDLDSFNSGRVKSGEVMTLRATFKAPKGAKKVGIKPSGIATFDDVELAP